MQQHKTASLYSTTWAIKKVPLNFRSYLCQILTDSKNSSSHTLHGQFSIWGLLNIPPHIKG